MKGKTIVVSGGTKGVGAAVVLACSQAGANVVIGGRDESAARQLIDNANKHGGRSIFVSTDLRDVKDCKKLADDALKSFGKIDGFFCYAGLTHSASLIEIDEDNFDSIFDVNIRAALFCSKYVVRAMKESGGGSIVLTGSPHAWGGQIDRVAYACSKGALLTLANHIAMHYMRFGIRANYLTMGWTPTEGEISLREKSGMSEEQLRAWASEMIPGGRMTEVNDVVPGVLYLLSDDSRMVSGANLRITGGLFI